MQELAARRERETKSLYQISSTLSKTSGMREVAAASARCLSSFLEMPVRAVLPRYEKQALLLSYDEHGAFSSRPLSHGEELKRTLEQSHVVPIQAGQETVCCFCLPQGTNLPSAQQALLDSILLQISTAMERELLNREKENAKSEIRQERLKSQLLRAISHDLRTPLAAIAGSAEILAQELDDPGQIETARSIYEDVSWLTRLVENILNLTRIQEDRLSLHIQPEAVEEVISSAVHRVAKYAPDKVIRIKIPDEVLFVPMDSRLMEQVLINLMDNAVKHTPPDAEIRLSVWKEGKRAWFEVSDNGPGVAEADLPNLFDMFYMAQEAPSDARRGIGLGLAICKAIVTSHGGEICAENMQEGGACFRFCLNL
ncbi:MAG: sensor histidine kinase, partial [Clostridiales bacterium]|nr:sensor histidine kinase [Clostridiales bacterium]